MLIVKRSIVLAGKSKMAFPKTAFPKMEFHGWQYNHQNSWPMAKIICVSPDKDNYVQNAQLLLVHVMVRIQYWTDQCT